MNKFKRQFGGFVSARDVTHKLQEAKWKAGNIISFIQAIEKALHKVTELQVTSTAPFNNMRTLKFKAQPIDNCVSLYRQSNVRRLLLASDYCRALFRYLNYAQRFDYSALGSSRKLGGANENLIDGSEKRISRLSLNFIVHMLFKGAVKVVTY